MGSLLAAAALAGFAASLLPLGWLTGWCETAPRHVTQLHAASISSDPFRSAFDQLARGLVRRGGRHCICMDACAYPYGHGAPH